MLISETRFTYNISTMGCKANLADTQELEERLYSLGGVAIADEEEADLFVLNTCTVTDQADKEANRILRKNKAKHIVATGCLAQVNPEGFKDPKITVVRNSAKADFEKIIDQLMNDLQNEQKLFHGERSAWHSSFLKNRSATVAENSQSAKTRAFYKFQDGCNAFCAYCVIPLARGRSRSLAANQVVQEIQALVDAGTKEVALTAIHAADYDSEGLDFTQLVEKILQETSVQRLRMTSLDPAEIPDSLLGLMATNPRLCAHFHVSLQAANTEVLKNMKRSYDSVAVENRLLAIAEKIPHAYVGMDIIAGFPGETTDQFESSYALLKRLPWTKAHVFPFSVRKNTAAARLVESGMGVPPQEISRRAKALRDLSQEKMKAALTQKVGTIQEVLMEEKTVLIGTRECSTGHARNFHKVVIPGKHEKNIIKRVKIIGFEKDFLKGELL